MLLERLKLFFGPKVCGELHAQLAEKYQKLEIQLATKEIRAKALANKNKELFEKIVDWHYRYHQLKLTFSVAMTEAPTFENYESVVSSKNEDIEHLEEVVAELSFKNSVLEQKLEEAKLCAKSSDWSDKRVVGLDDTFVLASYSS